jgi:hypothetical protein
MMITLAARCVGLQPQQGPSGLLQNSGRSLAILRQSLGWRQQWPEFSGDSSTQGVEFSAPRPFLDILLRIKGPRTTHRVR